MDRDYLSFASGFEDELKEGSKTETIRFNLQEKPSVGDELDAVMDTGEVIGTVEITRVEDMLVEDVPNRKLDGHRNYDSVNEVITHLGEYYHDTIKSDSIVTLISFKFRKE